VANYKPNDQVYWTFNGVHGWKNLSARIVGPGRDPGTWRIHLDELRVTVHADEKDLATVNDQDS
jgi:hypothetical protein